MHIDICAIGAVESRDQNQKNTEKIFEFIQEKTGLPLDRYMFIEYSSNFTISCLFYPQDRYQIIN
jgi:Macrophage migration inhibitory factor (MIF)